ncbi:MAG: ABC transporter permease [Proteobacteria bacterium]|nr:ABC transporter permease [Pseudomonadota bacterium]
MTDAVMNKSAQYNLMVITDKILQVDLYNDWTNAQSLPSIEAFIHQIELSPKIQRIIFNTKNLGQWDSLLILFINEIINTAKVKGIQNEYSSLPDEVQGLVKLAHKVPVQQTASASKTRSSFPTRLGENMILFFNHVVNLIHFFIEVISALGNFFMGKAHYRQRDLVWFIQDTGVKALPVVSLISILMGIVLAFLAAMQLALLGVEIYTSNLVAVGMTREMAPLMTAIIMAGRTGASFSAQLGTMQVNDEIDAFKTLGISPIEFLVLPRMLALILMLPILTIYADLLGIIGGLLVSTNMFDFSLTQAIHQTAQSIGLIDIFIGLFKAIVFAFLIAMSGCYYGINCGRSSASVGIATTNAVVMSIVSIVIADSIITVISTLIWKISIVN